MSDDDNDGSSGRHYRFDEGLPTKPDVDMLMRNWPDPKVGDRFDYEMVERILGMKREETRFKTITDRWRSRLKDEKRVVIYVDVGEAFYVASADQVVGKTTDRLRHVANTARHHRKDLATVKVENDQQRTVIEHQARLLLAVEKDAKKHRMNLLPSTQVKPQPQVAPPKSAEGKS